MLFVRIPAAAVGFAFDIAPDGHVYNVAVTSNTGNRVLADVVVRTVRETRIPPILPAVLATLEAGRMHAEYDFTVYQKQ